MNAALINVRCVKACGRLLSAWHTPAPIEAATWLGIQFFWKGVAVTGQASTSQKEHMLKCLSPAVYLALNKGGCRVPAKSARTKVLRRVTEVQGTLLTMQRAPEAAATTMALAALQLTAEPVTGYPLSGCLP